MRSLEKDAKLILETRELNLFELLLKSIVLVVTRLLSDLKLDDTLSNWLMCVVLLLNNSKIICFK